jgi:hypothetical protein
MHHARLFLHGRYARLEPFAQTDDVVQQIYVKILRYQDRFWVNPHGEPVRTLAEFSQLKSLSVSFLDNTSTAHDPLLDAA